MLPPVSLPIEKADERRRRRRARTGARAGRALFEQPRIHRLAAEPDVVQCERAEAELRDQHRAGVVETPHDRRIILRHAIAKRLGAPRRRDAGGVEQILHAVRNAVQWAAILACRDLGVGLLRLREREVLRQRDDAAQLAVVLRDAVEIDVGEPRRRELLLLDPSREMRDRCERDVGVVRRQRPGVVRAAHETIVRRTGARVPGSTGFQIVAGCTVSPIATLRGPDASLEQRRHRRSPRFRRHLALRGGHRHLRELLGFGERLRRDCRADPFAGVEGRAAHPVCSACLTPAL